jgi:hypothetical protein
MKTHMYFSNKNIISDVGTQLIFQDFEAFYTDKWIAVSLDPKHQGGNHFVERTWKLSAC